MRKDPYDDIDDVPSLSAKDDDDDFIPDAKTRERTTVYSRTTPVVKVKAPGTGALWALIGALFIAFCGLGWWSFQQVSLMEQQLVATQESFARISEEAAGRLQDISGKFNASESEANSGGEALKAQIKQLQDQLADQSRQQQGVAGAQGGLDKRLEQITSQAAAQQATTQQVQDQLKTITTELAALKAAMPDGKSAQTEQDRLDTQLKSLAADVANLKKSNNSQAIERLEQDMIVLKSEQDNRSAQPTSSGASTQEFDAFRGQMTRNLNTLQSQIQTLSQQINARGQ
ncbi:ATPase [Pseudomonas sp. GD03842]|uniref:ATPase n=1 Tax=Pseudomonas sp. GD03842 TaxID=2975385 RepID=UPI0024471779|nr:ATPase [Pseudomonas sp. GD03842]MDH0746389.1 ATPase [Pseudomonas sp. GD03842]